MEQPITKNILKVIFKVTKCFILQRNLNLSLFQNNLNNHYNLTLLIKKERNRGM